MSRKAPLVVAALAVLLAACAPPDTGTPTAGPSASGTPTSTAPSGGSTTSSQGATPQAKIVGGLTLPLGWTPIGDDGAPAPEVSWARQVDPVDRASAALAIGCTQPPRLGADTPISATEGLLARGDAPGVALRLSFDDDAAASSFHRMWVEQLRACSLERVEEVRAAPDVWAGHRVIDGARWTELGVRSGKDVHLLALGAELDEDQIGALLASQGPG